jgi:hypothetical protein
MITKVRERADCIATFRFASVFMMETLARWVPTTPELEAKILMGRHLWEFAQHADQFGRRTHELRAALHFTREPVAPYAKVLERLAAVASTGDRVDGFYDALLPDVGSRLRHYRDETDGMVDEPSVRILDRVLTDYDRMRQERDAMRADPPGLPAGRADWVRELRASLAAVSDVVDYREARS